MVVCSAFIGWNSFSNALFPICPVELCIISAGFALIQLLDTDTWFTFVTLTGASVG